MSRAQTQNQDLKSANAECRGPREGLNPWEAKVLVEAIEQVYFADPALREASGGQLKYSCVARSEPPGKKIADCQMVTVWLTLFDPKDQGELSYDGKQASIALRRRRLTRITDQAREQGQIVWPTVHRKEKSSYGKSIRNTELTPVILDRTGAEDGVERANGKRLRDMKKEAVDQRI